jgi:hypothetical protein
MKRLFNGLFSPFSRGQSSTFFVKRGFGGGRSCLKFLLENVDGYALACRLPVSSNTHTYVYVDPDLLAQATSVAYEQLVLESVHDAIGYDRGSKRIEDTQKALWSHLEQKELVIVLAGMSYLSFTDTQLWSRLRLLQVYPEKVHFLFVMYDGGPMCIDDERFARIRRLLHENTVRFSHLSAEDVEYSIDRWAYALECRFRERQREEIRKVSFGYPLLIKACCFAMADVARKERSIPLARHPYVLGVRRVERPVVLEDTEIIPLMSKILTPTEYDVCLLCMNSEKRVVSRDEVASVMWGDVMHKYSDAAITQLVSRLNRKLRVAGVHDLSVRAVYRRGYIAQRKEDGRH